MSGVYRLVATRFDGTQTTVLERMDWDSALRSQAALREAAIFVDVQVVAEDRLDLERGATDDPEPPTEA